MAHDPDKLKIFSDPELKAALGRAYPTIQAPDALQTRIRNLIDAELGAEQSLKLTLATDRTGWRQWFASGRQMAIAACVGGLVLGVGVFVLTSSNLARPTVARIDSGPTLVQTAVARHDALGQSVDGNAQFRQMLRTAPQMRDQLRAERSISLPLVDLSQQGWQFLGAKPGNDDGPCLGQLFFKRDKQTLSVLVFSDDQAARIPAACVIMQGHIVAMRKIDHGLLCVVGQCPSGQLPQSEVEQIATQFAQ